jgi:anthranilate phosphoribosyltransferase
MVVSGEVQSSKLEVQNANATTSSTFLDEFSTLGQTHLAEFYQERGFSCSTISPENFPLQPSSLKDLAGGDSKANAEIIRRIFSGDERGPKRDAVLLNAAAALLVAGKVKNLGDGWELAAKLIESGSAGKKLEELSRV